MVRKINNRLYKINTYASGMIVEVDDNYDDEIQEMRKEIQLDSIGYKLNLLLYLAKLTAQGYAISSVTEFNIDGSKPKLAYARNKDFKKIIKYLQNQTNVPEQIRAFFTTWAFLFRIDADAYHCEMALRRIYDTAGLDEVIDYDEFENYMVGLIV